MLRVGAHESISGGIYRALERGAEDGCVVIQIFTRSKLQWKGRVYSDQEIERWHQTRAATAVEPAMAHSSYLINLASKERALREKSYRALADEYQRCARLGIDHLVMHPGAHVGDGEVKGIARIASGLNRLFDEHPGVKTRLLLENTAGQGTCIGHRFGHLRDILGQLEAPERSGVCIDTCHLLAAGYDIRSPTAFHETFERFEAEVGSRVIRAFHLNDSKKPLGSRVDRHEHLGRGFVGLTAFRLLVNHPAFQGLPMTIETPKPSPHADRINLEILRALHGKQRLTKRAKRLATQPMTEPPS